MNESKSSAPYRHIKTSHHLDRLLSQVTKKLATIIQQDLRDPRCHGVSVSYVKLSPDSSQARVYVSLREESRKDDVLPVLKKAAPFIRHLLSKKLALRKTPELYFEFDDNLLSSLHLSEELAGIKLIEQDLEVSEQSQK